MLLSFLLLSCVCVSVTVSFGVISRLVFLSLASLNADNFALLMRMKDASTYIAYSCRRCIGVRTGHLWFLFPTQLCRLLKQKAEGR